MSYESTNTLPKGTAISAIKNLVELLGYKKCPDGFSIPERIGSYMWLASSPDISFVGVELSIYKSDDILTVHTRTRLGRSYWDLKQQNMTVKYLHDYLGGSFETDEGKNRYMRWDVNKPSRLASGLYLSRWIFNNALVTPRVYLNCRGLTGDLAKDAPTGLSWMDDMNPRFFSNSMLLPYILGAWEEYLRSSFVTLLQCSDCNSKVYKIMRIRSEDIEDILKHKKAFEAQLADSLSFQRPAIANSNFKAINERLDIAGCLRKPYNRRKKSLFDFIDEIVEVRNQIVHTATNNMLITDEEIKKIISDFEGAADRIYELFGLIYNFTPDRSY